LKKILAGVSALAAATIALVFIFDYDYLFKGIAKTYFRGQKSATIDDLKLFPSNTVTTANPKPWTKDSAYNKKPLPEHLLTNLADTDTASLLIVKDGKLLHEQYWNGYNEKTRSNSFSMAKTVTVMLLGMAMEERKISSLDQNFTDFYKNYEDSDFGRHLTLRDLAAMEAGLNWNENYKNPFAPNARAYYGNSLEQAIHSQGFKEAPGKRFEYQSGSTQLLGFAVQKAVDVSMAQYLSEKLWKPLGMEQDAEWTTDNSGMEKTFCCIHASPRDFAKLGQMMLNDGKMNGVQVLNREFLHEMITPTATSDGIYGLGIWINNDNPVKHYFMLGLQGQYVIVVPEHNMVIVRTGSYNDQPKNDRGRPDQVKYIVNEAVKLYT
jgi:CubicO group peptidase (beta-lactamase class C family)